MADPIIGIPLIMSNRISLFCGYNACMILGMITVGAISISKMIMVNHLLQELWMGINNTVNDESLEGPKFGEFGRIAIFRQTLFANI